MAISIFRTIIIYASLMLSMRVMGKRQLGELEPAELVIAVLISDLASHPLQDPGIPLLYGLIPVFTLLSCEVLISAGLIKSVRFRSFICGRPSILIDNGKIIQQEMRKNRYTVDELTEELRKKEILDIATVQYAILETDGTLSTILFENEAPITPKQMGVEVTGESYPVIIVNDGTLMPENLKSMGRNEKWLEKELEKRGVKDVKDVYVMSVDSMGKIYFAAKAKDAGGKKSKG